LDEALGLAVGLRSIGASVEVLNAQSTADGGEAFGSKRRAVVGEHAADPYAQASEISQAGA
jgi:hypothetical protein